MTSVPVKQRFSFSLSDSLQLTGQVSLGDFISLLILHNHVIGATWRTQFCGNTIIMPTDFTMNQVLQPFVSEKFNFTKVSPLEVIFRFNETEKDSAQYFDGVPDTVSASSSAILINVSAPPSVKFT